MGFSKEWLPQFNDDLRYKIVRDSAYLVVDDIRSVTRSHPHYLVLDTLRKVKWCYWVIVSITSDGPTIYVCRSCEHYRFTVAMLRWTPGWGTATVRLYIVNRNKLNPYLLDAEY